MKPEDQAATKGDLSELDAKIDRVALEVVRTQADLHEIKGSMSTKDDVERIMRAIDGFAAQAIHYQRADATRGKAIIDIEVGIADHERRITGLESSQTRPHTR
ncbi:MAG TPA: hypothetical protein DEB40_00745 [Elusimicrobia bacterium]|nr:hypothetical protein [Elusimicrobiota bacterium]HBT60256.1 hypothetical protein [Elusimicrobiota bacterium]